MTENAVHEPRVTAPPAPKAASFGARHRRGFVTAAIVGLLLTFVGALETGELPFLPRLAYWEILMLSGALIGLGVTEGVGNWGRLRSRPALEIPLVALLIALPLTFMVIGTSNLFFRTSPPSLEALGIMFGITFAISMVMTVINYLFNSPAADSMAAVESDTPFPPPVQAPSKTSRFNDRLPLNMQSAKITALQAEDHYLRVHFDDGGSTLILMRLSDAITELPADSGAQTHRSWWVAKDAVHGVTKGEGRAILKLNAPLEAPVSRSFYKALNDAGWLG